MKKTVNILWLILGWLSLAIGSIGVVLPVLPTTPFLLVASFSFAKGSDRFHRWFTGTKLYKKHLEDFVRSDTASVTVSTMHKVKGKEFDTVFLVLDRFQQKDDKDRRLLYVALTRAKDNLSIHMNSSLLDGFTVEGIERYNNTRQYSPSEERTLLLSLSDIWLSDSGTRQRAISDLRSGDLLYADETECRNAKGQTVLKFSNVFKKKLAAFISNGYSVVEAKVNFIVWWKGEDMDKEIRIVLPVLHIAGKI